MTAAVEPTVDARGLRRHFGETVAVDCLDLTVHPGQIVGLVGPDGAGKTTTLRMLAGVLAPSAGTALICGFDVVAKAGEVRRRVGYVAQRFALYGDLTVAENARFFADIYGVTASARAEREGELREMSGLGAFQDRLADQLSGGMKQKLALTCALIHRPQLLVLDEPTAGVDPISRRDLWRILERLRGEGLTIVLATAYMDEAERCDRLVLLSAGRAIAQGTPDELRALLPGSIVEVFLRDSSPTALRRARDASLKAGGVRGAQLFGDRLHVTLDRAEMVGGLVAALEGTTPVASAQPVAPSIEDVFLAVRGP